MWVFFSIRRPIVRLFYADAQMTVYLQMLGCIVYFCGRSDALCTFADDQMQMRKSVATSLEKPIDRQAWR